MRNPDDVTPQSTDQPGRLEAVDIVATRHVIDIDPRFNVPYVGVDATVKATFPEGFPVSLGSGLAYQGKDDNGDMLFYVLTDRGPNASAPDTVAGLQTKVFPAPDFSPKFGTIRLAGQRATLQSLTELRRADGTRITGLPKRAGIGSTGEIPLTENLRATLPFDEHGLDTEGIAIDAHGRLWLGDEYGPYLLQVDARSGRILQKLGPGSGLPDVLQFRQPNRGFEGVAVTPNGRVYGVLQSPLKMPALDGAESVLAPFIRLVEYDPVTTSTRMFAYAVDTDVYPTGDDVKLGDLAAIDDTTFLLIEQGTQVDGVMHNAVVLIDLASATDLSSVKPYHREAEYLRTSAALAANGIVPVKRVSLIDLREKDESGNSRYGWTAEKAEGVSMIDDRTIAITNDNDFRLTSGITDHAGNDVAFNKVRVDLEGRLTAIGRGPCERLDFKLGLSTSEDSRLYLWLFRLPKPLKDYLAA